MGIKVEFCPDLALRNIEEFEKGNRKKEECIPEELEKEKIYNFLKKDQKNYWFFGEIPLVYTKGSGILSRPVASVIIVEATHFLFKGEIYTKGKYKVMEVFNDDKIHFEGYEKINFDKNE